MITTNSNACPQNHPCPTVHRCPAGAIIQDDMYSAPHIDQELCTDCGACSGVCRVFVRVAEQVAVA
jgi:ferredoxin